MFYHLLIGVVGVVALTGAWIAIQALARRQSPELPGDRDVLECSVCDGHGSCHCGIERVLDEALSKAQKRI